MLLTISASNGDTKKITDWITSKKPIYWRHPINLNDNIKDITHKRSAKSVTDTTIYHLSLWYKQCDTNNEIVVAYSNTQHCSIPDAKRKTPLNDTQNCFRSATTQQTAKNSHSISQSCLLEGKRKPKYFKKKQHNKQWSSRRKSAPLTSVINITLLPWFELTQISDQKSQHQNPTFYASSISSNIETAWW